MLRILSPERCFPWLCLVGFLAAEAGCVVNPVPTPEKTATGVMDNAEDAQSGGTGREKDVYQPFSADAKGTPGDLVEGASDVAADVTVDVADGATTDVAKR